MNKTDFLLFLEQYDSMEIYKNATKKHQEIMFEFYEMCGKVIGFSNVDVDRLIEQIYKVQRLGLQELPKFRVNTDTDSIIEMYSYTIN